VVVEELDVRRESFLHEDDGEGVRREESVVVV
jgi:hypothetical protein